MTTEVIIVVLSECRRGDLLLSLVLRAVEFIEQRINKSTDER